MEIRNIVSTEKMAAELAEVYVANIYGADAAQAQKPYAVQALPDEWRVEGTLAPTLLGGTFDLRLSRTDGRLLALDHSR